MINSHKHFKEIKFSDIIFHTIKTKNRNHIKIKSEGKNVKAIF